MSGFGFVSMMHTSNLSATDSRNALSEFTIALCLSGCRSKLLSVSSPCTITKFASGTVLPSPASSWLAVKLAAVARPLFMIGFVEFF